MMVSAESVGAARKSVGDQDLKWARWMLVVLIALSLARLGVIALGLKPLHFDEAQYWTYAKALDAGYYSKPPMAAWLIAFSTWLFGDTEFGVRFFAPWLHGLIAWFIFLSGRRLFDARAGFWAGVAYLTLPGVVVSSELLSTDPPMMAAWAGALYALIRAFDAEEAGENSLIWWVLVGVAVGLGLNSKYTIIAFVGGGLGYALFSREGVRGARQTQMAGPLLAVAAALVVWAPNLFWNAANGFASIAHVADNANLGGGPQFNILKSLEFFGAQVGIFGPVLFALAALMLARGRWRHEWGYRLLLWMSLPLIIAMTIQAFLSRAHPNWAAPSYIALTIATVAWMLDRRLQRWMIGAVASGAITMAGLVGLGVAYAESPTTLERLYDPFKKIRPQYLVCARALPYLREGELMASSSRRILGVCAFYAGRGVEDIRIRRTGPAGNHYQLVSPLHPGDETEMLLILRGDVDHPMLETFENVDVLESGVILPHGRREGARQRDLPYVVARVSGYQPEAAD